MTEMTTLLDRFWVLKEKDREAYYRVKRDIPHFQRFVREQLGWKLLHTENLIKLEKVPAHAESFMGISAFTEVRDYCVLCVVLMFLEDKEEQEQFLLSELIDFVSTTLSPLMNVDWTSFSQRKSLVRVLQYMEKLGMLAVYEGSSEAFGQESGREVLYENTGCSRYFATSFGYDISSCTSWKDFEQVPQEAGGEESLSRRVNRIYRELAVCPALYWEDNDESAYYVRNQRGWIARYLGEQLGGRLDVHKNAAFLVFEEGEGVGTLHPRDAMLPEAVLLVCARVRELLLAGVLVKNPDETILVKRSFLEKQIRELKRTWNGAWSKEYREMEEDRAVAVILRYMETWMMAEVSETEVLLLPAAGKLTGYYPEDYVTEDNLDGAENEED